MMKDLSSPRKPHPRHRSRQRGVVLLLSLIALGIVLILAATLMRSFRSSMFNSGNIGFKRDMQNQSELAANTALTAFRTGGLNTSNGRKDSNVLLNYSATMLPVNSHGIPNALLASDADFAAVGTAADLQSTDHSVTLRYVIDRMCSTTGDEKTLSSGSCMLAANPTPAGTSSSNLQGADRQPLCPTCASAAPQGVVYRLSIRATGPRGTQSFFQSTFTVPSS